MQRNHAKAIKGMSIACVALSGAVILLCLIGMAVMSALGPLLLESMTDSYYDYYDFYSSYQQTGLEGMLAAPPAGSATSARRRTTATSTTTTIRTSSRSPFSTSCWAS